MIKKNDLILIAIVIFLCIGIFAYISFTKEEGSKLVITIDGEVYKTLDMSEDITLTLEDKNGETNTLQIKDGYADMTDASCPDLLCVKQHKIHYNHETIVCLPNRVVLEVVDGDESEVDMIAN